MRRGKWFRVLVCLAVLGSASGCIGAVDRADFEHQIRTRGGGLVSTLPQAAIAALTQRTGATDLEANLIILTPPNSSQFRLALNDQPDQVARFLAEGDDLTTREPTVRLRVRPPDRSRQLDDYSFTLDALSSPRPVRVSAFDDLDGEDFTISEVPGLSRIEDIVDTALTHSALPDGQVTVIVVSRFGHEIRVVANILSPRSEMIAEFDRTGTFLRLQQV
ncbi:hypothetical protein OG874_06280 [Nocardia sp. NBC_00565]|uniref:hypothetical protein n=1 Tax=Nocardia sp. NBC_00565 TaxID=2975993 RepID=UPI002E80972E|nr:hypothetical protein [Nocardia sp. NBC_00565]WUC04773.1 hypothetical protein OG874_06280 [Nocardia sp. NBC_00565]